MQVIYSGFDNLDVSYRGRISDDLMEKLESAQEEAIRARQLALLQYAGLKMHVAEGGSKGGYAFKCDTGPLGATWFFKRPNAKDPWGIRVSSKSLMLSTYGLDGARERIEGTLAALGCTLLPQPESIGRVDFAVDVLAPGFELNPENFVLHARTTRTDHEEIEVLRSHGGSGRYTSVTVGKMPGRQVIVYDKRLEATRKPEKAVWFDIWRAALASSGRQPVDFSDPFASAVWRVEVRAGKQCLKDKYKVTTWRDLTEKLQGIFNDTLDRSRYSVPKADSNRSRWPEHRLWELGRSRVSDIAFDRVGLITEEAALEACRTAQLQIIDQQLVGLAATRVALASGEKLPADLFPTATQPVRRAVYSDEATFAERVSKARDRYANLT